MKKAVSYCQIDDSYEAGRFVASDIIDKFGGMRPDIYIVFATIGHTFTKLVEGFRSVAKDTPLCGCSGLGIISNYGCDEATYSLGAMGLKSDQIQFHPFLCEGLKDNDFAVGRQVGQVVNALPVVPGEDRLLMLLPDGLHVNASELSRGMEESLQTPLRVVGGSAGNDWRYTGTYQFCNDRVTDNGVAGVLMTGAFHYEVGLSHGSRAIGPARTVTRSEGAVIYEVDGKPATDMLRTYLDEDQLLDFGQMGSLIGLGVLYRGHGYQEDCIIRAIIEVDIEKKSMRMATSFPEGTCFRLMMRDKCKVQERTKEMTRGLLARLSHPDEAAYFYFECAGRGSYLFGEPDPDITALLQTLGHSRDLLGFFTFGEFGSVEHENLFHNFTGILLAVEE
ncbi:MAG: hypothetical protein EOM20_04990 [Spartobacteria bacterium]|nr:hypothetical protein [Spartobacteria bacterium]